VVGVTDWVEILRDEKKTAERMQRDAGRLLADPAMLPDQARTLFEALEKQAVFVEKLRQVLDGAGYEPDIVHAAERLEEVYAELAADVAEGLKRMQG
jgi:hypothetical protein